MKVTPAGPQATIRGTRVAVWHIAASLQGGTSVDEIINEGLPHLPPAAIHEAIAYYHDHEGEINAEVAANSQEAVYAELRERMTPEHFDQLTGRTIT